MSIIIISTLSFFQVYEEKEKMWERELRKIKGLYDNRLRASQQKSSKMEQALTNQTYQVSIFKKDYIISFAFGSFISWCFPFVSQDKMKLNIKKPK